MKRPSSLPVVARTPEARAVVFEDEVLSYAELNARANQLAHHLRGLGVGPDVLVAICVERSLEMVVGVLGILKAGGAYVPLEPSYPAERLAFMLQDCAPRALLTQTALQSLPFLQTTRDSLPVIELPREIRPLDPKMVLAGPVFTVGAGTVHSPRRAGAS